MQADGHEQFTQWLLSSIALDAAALHVGRYCGPWRASTAGHAQASFHLVLQGECYLHLAGQPPLKLREREGVFLMRDVAHFVSPDLDPDSARRTGSPVAMAPLDSGGEDNGAGLACGFFRFSGTLAPMVIDALPPYLICRGDNEDLRQSGALFDLILAEAGGDPERPSALVARLVELLFFYLIRHAVRRETLTEGLLALVQREEFMALLGRMLLDPGLDWSIARMADAVHMSRAAFCKHFTGVGGMPPAQFLLRLRMKAAEQRLQAGDSVEQAAGHVGYQSSAAFTRAFKRIVGAQPGAYRRESRVSQLSPTPQQKTFGQKTATMGYGANVNVTG